MADGSLLEAMDRFISENFPGINFSPEVISEISTLLAIGCIINQSTEILPNHYQEQHQQKLNEIMLLLGYKILPYLNENSELKNKLLKFNWEQKRLNFIFNAEFMLAIGTTVALSIAPATLGMILLFTPFAALSPILVLSTFIVFPATVAFVMLVQVLFSMAFNKHVENMTERNTNESNTIIQRDFISPYRGAMMTFFDSQKRSDDQTTGIARNALYNVVRQQA